MSTQTARLVPMTAAHLDAVMEHEHEMFGTESWTRNGYLGELADTRDRHYVVAEDDDGTLLGWAGLLIAGSTGEILTVGVVPAARRRGVARALLADLLAEAVRRGADEAMLEVRVDNGAARALYGREGFLELGVRRGFYDHGRVDAVTMRRDLSLLAAETRMRASGAKSGGVAP